MDEVKLNPVDDFIDKFPHMLSGGQQQRVVIARAMILEPKLIVADEPVSMLDASVRVEILKLLEKLQETHDLAVIYITHDLSTVRYFSERIFVMYAGKLVERAKVDDLLNDPRHPYTHALLAATSDPDAKNATVFKEVPPAASNVLYVMLGSLATAFTTVVSFFFGSSKGSSKKTEAMQRELEKKGA